MYVVKVEKKLDGVEVTKGSVNLLPMTKTRQMIKFWYGLNKVVIT